MKDISKSNKRKIVIVSIFIFIFCFSIGCDKKVSTNGENNVVEKHEDVQENQVDTNEFIMDYDYYINGNKIKFTRDKGKTWIDVDISEENMKETLGFYRKGVEIPKGSYYISEDERKPIAFFYGEKPTIRISKDNGKTWNSIYFDVDLGKDITRRIISFIDENNGYAALGTEWSMGTGESKRCYFTTDGGKTWNEKNLPMNSTNRKLTGMSFCDMKQGVLSLEGESESKFPLLFFTGDGADSWTEINFPWNTLDKSVSYISDIDSLTFKDGVYTLTLGQGSSGEMKAVFESNSLNDGWKFVKSYKGIIHTVG